MCFSIAIKAYDFAALFLVTAVGCFILHMFIERKLSLPKESPKHPTIYDMNAERRERVEAARRDGKL